MNKKERKQFLKDIKPIMRDLHKIEKKYGSAYTLYSMRLYLRQTSDERIRTREIRRLQGELEELNKRKI
jgi:hypothetical protein